MDIEIPGSTKEFKVGEEYKGKIIRYVISGDLTAGKITRTVKPDSSEIINKSFYHLDHLNSTKMVTDESGAIEANYTYRAFGEQLNALQEKDAKYTYGGKELDSNTNLYYFNARFYDATIGRFINVDPIQDGTNWYVYCSNNPLNRVDPTGLEDVKPIPYFGSRSYQLSGKNRIRLNYYDLVEVKKFVDYYGNRDVEVQKEPSVNWASFGRAMLNLGLSSLPAYSEFDTLLTGLNGMVKDYTDKQMRRVDKGLSPFIYSDKGIVSAFNTEDPSITCTIIHSYSYNDTKHHLSGNSYERIVTGVNTFYFLFQKNGYVMNEHSFSVKVSDKWDYVTGSLKMNLFTAKMLSFGFETTQLRRDHDIVITDFWGNQEYTPIESE